MRNVKRCGIRELDEMEKGGMLQMLSGVDLRMCS